MDRVAPSPPAHKIRARSGAKRAEALPPTPPEIFLATSKRRASMPPGLPPRATAAPPPLQVSAKAATAPPSSRLSLHFAGRRRGETILVHHGFPRGAFYVFEKGLRRFFLLRTLHRRHCRPSIRRMRWICNRDFLNRGILQRVHTLRIQIDLYALRHPNHNTPHRVVVQRS